MKQSSMVVMMIVSSILLATACSYEEDPVEEEPIPTEALDFVRGMGFGMNIGNTFDSLSTTNVAGETGWGNPRITREFIRSLKDHGFKTVRLPVSWVDYMGTAPDYTIAETWITRVEEVVNWILDEGLYCIVNIHHDGGGEINTQGYINPKYWIKQISLPDQEDAITNRFARVWEQIAMRFRDAPDLLVLEGMNEIGFDNIWNRYAGGNQESEKAEAYRLVNKLNQTFVDAVRATGGSNEDRYLLIPGYWTDIVCTIDPAFIMPADTAENRLILSVHFYDPYLFTMEQRLVWGNVPVERQVIVNQIKKLETPFLNKGIPVVIGEYAVNIRTSGRSNGTLKDSDSRQNWMLHFTQTCLDLGITPVLWETGMRSSNHGMADIRRNAPFTISDNLKFVFDNIVYPD